MPYLTALWNWLTRLLGGWIPLGNKPIGEYLGKILWAAGIVFACLFLWNKFSAPSSAIKTGSQKAESIINVYHSETVRPLFGCASLRVIEYYADKKKQEEVK